MRLATQLLILAVLCFSACAPPAELTEREWTLLSDLTLFSPDESDVPESAPANAGRGKDFNPFFNDPGAQQLGRKLYFDKAFSADGDVSCDSCHQAKFSGADPREGPTSPGVFGVLSDRNSPTLYNAGLRPTYSWLSVEEVLWRQITKPITGGFHGLKADEVADYVCSTYPEEYKAIFGACNPLNTGAPVYGCNGVGGTVCVNAAKAIAAYVRTLHSRDSAFDRFMGHNPADVDPTCMTEPAARGARLFVGKASCNECHSGPTLSDGQKYTLGVGSGDRELDSEGNLLEYQVPPMRQISATGPYMHDGSLESLWDVLEFYRTSAGTHAGDARPPEVRAPLLLSLEEMNDLEAFLVALDGAPLDYCWVNDDDHCCTDEGEDLPELPEDCPQNRTPEPELCP